MWRPATIPFPSARARVGCWPLCAWLAHCTVAQIYTRPRATSREDMPTTADGRAAQAAADSGPNPPGSLTTDIRALLSPAAAHASQAPLVWGTPRHAKSPDGSVGGGAGQGSAAAAAASLATLASRHGQVTAADGTPPASAAARPPDAARPRPAADSFQRQSTGRYRKHGWLGRAVAACLGLV